MNTLPPALDRFGAELENAARRDLGTRRRRRRTIRGAAVLAAVAATALGLLSVVVTSATAREKPVRESASACERRQPT